MPEEKDARCIRQLVARLRFCWFQKNIWHLSTVLWHRVSAALKIRKAFFLEHSL
jgi:hypothetical protein